MVGMFWVLGVVSLIRGRRVNVLRRGWGALGLCNVCVSMRILGLLLWLSGLVCFRTGECPVAGDKAAHNDVRLPSKRPALYRTNRIRVQRLRDGESEP